MQKHPVIEFETSAGRSDEAIVRRLYSVELPFVFEREREKYFAILEDASISLGVPINDIKVCGSAQTGYSFHEGRPFQNSKSDLDLAIINSTLFERLLRSAQRVSLPNPDSAERPRRTAFPVIQGNSVYSNFTENAALYGMILPWQMPDCGEKLEVLDLSSRLTEAYTPRFKEINFAVYLSPHFFERKQRPNIGIYRNGRRNVL